MLNAIKEPMTKPAGHVHTTKDYAQFKTLDGNRQINVLHLKRLKASMQDIYLMSPIIVNEKKQIIDGQHRFQCAVDLKLPVNYIICNGYGLKEVQVLNANTKNWSYDDFVDGYCDLGVDQYLMYREFRKRFEFPHSICQILLSGSHESGTMAKAFQGGKFKIKSWDKAVDIAEKLQHVGKYYPGFQRRSFTMAMITLLKNPKFDFVEFIHKMKQQPSAMVDCTNTSMYLELIEQIYNYRSRDKVNLRFSK